MTADCDKAQLFNAYFSSVFTTEDKSSLPSIAKELDVSNSAIMLDSVQTTSSEVFDLLSTLDVCKACGPDLICARLLKEGAAELSFSLADLFNKSLRDSVLPLDWVSANICPVYKKGDKHCVSNYRPISLTCILSRVLEKLVYAKLYFMLEDNGLLSNHQFGFRHKQSTTTLLLSAVNDWAATLNCHQSVHCLFLDLSKAFDSVPHERLLLKLQLFGVGGSLLLWFRNYLTTRRQRVVLNGTYSNWLPVTSGVPQGSILGPLLFIMYLNDLDEVITCDYSAYADDVMLYHQIASYEDCCFLQSNLDSFLQWCSRWQMSLQPQKCEALCITNKRLPIDFTYYCSTYPLGWSKSVKYLGVVINGHLTWSDHCKSVCSKATRVLNFLRRKLYCCSSVAKSRAYSALILPLFLYSCQVWLPHYQKDIMVLESVQRRAARWVCNSQLNPSCYSWTHSSDVCISRLGWPSIMARLTASCLLFVFDLLHKRFAMSFSDFFKFNTSVTKSHSMTLVCKQSVVNAYRYSFFVNSVFIWNRLPFSVVSVTSRSVFRSSVYKFLCVDS